MIVQSTDRKALALDIKQVQKNFENWRGTRTKRGPIPKHLWDQAIALTSCYPVSEISRALRLNATDLARKASLASSRKPQSRRSSPDTSSGKTESLLKVVKLLPSHIRNETEQPRPPRQDRRPGLVAEIVCTSGLSVRMFDGIDMQTLQVLTRMIQGDER